MKSRLLRNLSQMLELGSRFRISFVLRATTVDQREDERFLDKLLVRIISKQTHSNHAEKPAVNVNVFPAL